MFLNVFCLSDGAYNFCHSLLRGGGGGRGGAGVGGGGVRVRLL